MAHSFLDGKKVGTRFIEMQPEGVAERVKVEAETGKTGLCQLVDKDVTDGLLTGMRTVFLSGEQPVFRLRSAVRRADVRDQEIKCFIRKDGVAVRAVLAAGDIDAVL